MGLLRCGASVWFLAQADDRILVEASAALGSFMIHGLAPTSVSHTASVRSLILNDLYVYRIRGLLSGFHLQSFL
jgi:hypothetical protein